jgi:ADP-heptose:LPS heptosyltransferase
MKVDTMRRIDRGVGIPLCFLLSPLVWIVDLFRGGRRRKPDPSRTLFIELSEMGSAVIADPAMRKLRAEGPAELFFAIFEKNAKSLEILKTVPGANVFLMRPDNLFVLAWDVLRFLCWCLARGITCVIDLEMFSRFTAILSLLSGARFRVGFASFHDEGLYRGALVNRPVRYNPHVHVAVNFASLVNTALGKHDTPYATTPVRPEELRLEKAEVGPDQADRVRKKLRELYPAWKDERAVLFNVNASDLLPQRRWPPENFARVARELIDGFPDIVVVATGAPGERDYVQKVVDEVGRPRCVNSAGFFAFDELVPLYAQSALMLTNDSGPAHFAAVTPLKVFVLFGPETPALYLPLGGNAEPFYLGLPCSPCVSAANHRKTSCLPRPCITGIEPAVVSRRLREHLGSAGAH